MRVSLLRGSGQVYTGNAYLIRGEWNRIEDRNTLIDVGTDGSILEELEGISTGVGKRRVEQVLFTHGHFDHTGGLKRISERFHPEVFAFQRFSPDIHLVTDGQVVHLGDEWAHILHTPGHSNDSICIYAPASKALFSGDTPLRIQSPGGTYTAAFLAALERIALLDIETIYPGHESPIQVGIQSMLARTLEVVRAEVASHR